MTDFQPESHDLDPVIQHDEIQDDTAAPRRRRRPGRLLAFGAAGALLLGIGAGGGALAASQLQVTSPTGAISGTTGSGTQSGSSGSAFGPGASTSGGSAGSGSTAGGSTSGGFGQGFGQGTQGGSSQGSTQSGTTTGTAASTSQSVGVVTVVSKLQYQSATAAGTGIVLTSTGEILTNNHVIDGATSITVTVASTGKSYVATVVGTDATHDIAVLQLKNASGLATAKLASTAAAEGSVVTAIGNAGGGGTLRAASGTVTATGKSITTAAESGSASERLTGLIETDADVVSGDSGGPLLNASGEVVGIDTAASSGTSDVTGFAIPIAKALDIATEIIRGDDTADITLGYPAFLGIEVATGSTGTGTGSATGATIGEVITGTPAASAGLVAGDRITAVDGHAVASPTALTTRLHTYEPGDRVALTVVTATGSTSTVTVTLTSGPAD